MADASGLEPSYGSRRARAPDLRRQAMPAVEEWRPSLFTWPVFEDAEEVEQLAAWLSEVVPGIRRRESALNLARYLAGVATCGPGLRQLNEIAAASGLSSDQIDNLLKPRRPPWSADALRHGVLAAVLPKQIDGVVIEQHPLDFGRHQYDLLSAYAFWADRMQLLVARRTRRNPRDAEGSPGEEVFAHLADAEDEALRQVCEEVRRLRGEHDVLGPTIVLQPWIGEMLRSQLFLSGDEYLVAVDASFLEHGFDPVDFGVDDRLPGYGRPIAVHLMGAPLDEFGIAARELAWQPRAQVSVDGVEHGMRLVRDGESLNYVARPLDAAPAGPAFRAQRLELRSRALVRTWSAPPLGRLARRYALHRLHIPHDGAFDRHVSGLVALNGFCGE
jgi:hypothetical protein